MTPDPADAMAVATALISGPLMANHHHGLWGYHGPRVDSERPLSVHSIGIGSVCAGLVVAELIEHGARRVVLLGRFCPFEPATGPLLVDRAWRGGELVLPAPGLRAALTATSIAAGAVATFDPLTTRNGNDSAAIAGTDLESAGVLAAASGAGAAAAAILLPRPAVEHEGEEERDRRERDELIGLARSVLSALDAA